jgi:hypothetical protein
MTLFSEVFSTRRLLQIVCVLMPTIIRKGPLRFQLGNRVSG